MADIYIDDSIDQLTVDQADYEVDGTLNVQVGVRSLYLGDLIITNSSDSPDALKLTVLKEDPELHLIQPTNLFLDDGANVKLVAYDASTDIEPYLRIDNGSTLELTPELLSSGQVPFYIRVLGSSKLIYDSTGTNIDQSSSVIHLDVMEPGSELQVIGADSYSYIDDVLTFKNSDGEIVGNFKAPWLNDPMELEGDILTITCYLKGTHIATPDGEVKVETLKAGDKVLTATGGVATVKWLGFRKLNRNRIPESHVLRASPIRICKGAFAENTPHRDLTVSPGHRFNFDGALVPALSLVNGLTIIQDFDVQQFEYYHVELEKFDMLLAEGAAAESYLDVGDYRQSFENAHTVAAHPDFGPAPERVVLPDYVQKITPEIIQPIRQELFGRVQALTGATRSGDANLRIEANGVMIASLTPCAKRGVYRFELPTGLQSDIRILSNSTVIRETSLNSRRDMRIVGVGLNEIVLVVDGIRHQIDITDKYLTGLHDVQEVNNTNMRWTTGEAVIPANLVPASKGSMVLELSVLRTNMYWTSGEQLKARKAA
ncbi:Hint domain-containing protein [Advenella sp. FME57]|uniref:Hint domain-containing protein n=1 Tax=Advenella sp. FME57 TaxID=2742604 RepID=UPI001867A951|nr:Hint domain-containing protein [Advenella sp. FME57]